MKLQVKKSRSNAVIPTRANNRDAGFDLYSTEDYVLYPNEIKLILTGIHLDIPEGYVGIIKDRSSMASKLVRVGGGVIDSGYTGEVKVCLTYHGAKKHVVNTGDKVAQIVFFPLPEVELEETTELQESDRGTKGFGSSGI